MTSGIYSIANSVNGKRYIGSSTNIRRRWCEHASRLKRGCHENEKLQRAWLKYGEAAFSFVTLEIVEAKADQLIREQHWIDSTNSVSRGYNISTIALGGAGGARTGIAYENIVAANMRRSGAVVSLATREKMAAAHLGKKHKPETIAKIGESQLGKIISIQHKAALSAAMAGNQRCVGRRLSDETKAKISAARRFRGIDTLELP